MSKKIKENILEYQIQPDNQNLQKIITEGSEILTQKRNFLSSPGVFFFFTVKFISLKTWLMQFGVLVLTVLLIMNHILNQSSLKVIFNSYLLILVFSIIFFIDELYKSFTTGMWELEQTFKYGLLQHTVMKLLVFGLFDLILIIIISFISKSVLSIPVLRTLLYLLVFYNIFFLIIFFVVTSWRNQTNKYLIWTITGGICSIILIIFRMFDIYLIDIKLWISVFVITSILLISMVYRKMSLIFKEVL